MTPRPCPECGKRTKPHGPPVPHGYFLDQIIVCPSCDWCGVQSQIIAEPRADLPQQLSLFEP